MSELTKFMTPNVGVARLDATLSEACQLMRQHRSSYLVIEDQGKPVGVLTEEDIVRRAIPEKVDLNATKTRAFMSTPAPTIESNQSMEDANSLMKIRGCRVVVIVEGNKIVGAITLLGLLWCLEARGQEYEG